MDADDIVKFLKTFRWSTLQMMYGCAHSSIIGFVSTEWISQSEYNSILDGAPSPIIGQGRTGQQNADILLCKGNKPFIVVEVQTEIKKYEEKVDSILSYLHNGKDFSGLEFGLLIMTNCAAGDLKYRHNWDSKEIKSKVDKAKGTIALVSIEKSRIPSDNSVLGRLRSRNDYYPWEIVNIDCRVHTADRNVEGNLWNK